MTRNRRFCGWLLGSAAVHLAVAYSLGWGIAQAPNAYTAAPVALAATLHVAERNVAADANTLQLMPLPLEAGALRVLTTTARAAERSVPSEPTIVPPAPQQAAVSHQRNRSATVADLVAPPMQSLTHPRPQTEENVPVVEAEIEAESTVNPEDASDRAMTALAQAPVAVSLSVASNAGDAYMAAAGKASFEEGVGRRLLESLHKHFSYPLRARRKGWEGDVLLGVDLDEAGVIAEVRLLASSGYATLDRAAIASMRAVGALEQHLNGRLTVEVPVRYRLIN